MNPVRNVNLLERLKCHDCGGVFTFVNPDTNIPALIAENFPVPKQQTCNFCLRARCEPFPAMKAHYHQQLRIITSNNLKNHLLAG